MDFELWAIAKSIIGWLAGIAVLVGGWLWTRVVSDLKVLEEDVNARALELKDFKLHVAETHPTKGDLVSTEAKTRETLSRLHDRIDVVGEDIKKIIGLVGNGDK